MEQDGRIARIPQALVRLGWYAARVAVPRRRVRSRGLTFTLQCDNWMTRARWLTYNSKEPQTLDWVDRWIRHGDVVFDVGANIGVYSIYAALRHPGARIVAFEPEYANLHLLRDNIVRNRLQDRIEVYSVALGRHCGISRLHVQDLTPGTALHTESKAPLRVTASGRPVIWREGIYTITLDAFCQETGVTPQAVKLDVDGTESEVLEGAAGTLRSPALRSVLLEQVGASESQEACRWLLAAAGLHREPFGDGQKLFNELWVRI